MLRRSIIISSLFLLTAAYMAKAMKMEPVPVRQDFAGFPRQIESWEGYPLPDFKDNIIEQLRVDDYINRIYIAPNQSQVSLYIGYYRSQRQGSTMHSPMNCLLGSGWNSIKKTHIRIPVGADKAQFPSTNAGPVQEIEVNNIVVQKGMERQVVLYWYQSHGRVVASEYWGKIYTVLDAVRMNRTDAAIVRIVCPVRSLDSDEIRTAEECAIDFVKSVFPLLAQYLPA